MVRIEGHRAAPASWNLHLLEHQRRVGPGGGVAAEQIGEDGVIHGAGGQIAVQGEVGVGVSVRVGQRDPELNAQAGSPVAVRGAFLVRDPVARRHYGELVRSVGGRVAQAVSMQVLALDEPAHRL